MACQDNLSFMRPLADETMQLIVTSPPYNIGKAYEARSSLDDYLDTQRKVIAESVRLLNGRGSLCWQVGNHVRQDRRLRVQSGLDRRSLEISREEVFQGAEGRPTIVQSARQESRRRSIRANFRSNSLNVWSSR